ncbi:MAG: magnesium transporter CorA family protein [Paracoccaceae bacterium]
MLFAYALDRDRLLRLPPEAPLDAAVWVDLFAPQPEQVARVEALGVPVPTLADMEEIEISNRLYREGRLDYMTVVLPGQSVHKVQTTGPVTFILGPGRLVTVRHHAPRPFETFPDRADKSVAGCATPARVFLGLVEEIVGRLADLLEGAGRTLDQVARTVFGGGAEEKPDVLQGALEATGREGEVLGRVRLGLLTLERAITFFGQAAGRGDDGRSLKEPIRALQRDLQALEVHADFLSARMAHITDATLGMVNLVQNTTVRILSVVAALFLPPTLIGTVYGMNFRDMPELGWGWGYPFALALMVASALVTYIFLRWKKWL